MSQTHAACRQPRFPLLSRDPTPIGSYLSRKSLFEDLKRLRELQFSLPSAAQREEGI